MSRRPLTTGGSRRIRSPMFPSCRGRRCDGAAAGVADDVAVSWRARDRDASTASRDLASDPPRLPCATRLTEPG